MEMLDTQSNHEAVRLFVFNLCLLKNLIANRLGSSVNDNIQKTHMDCKDGWILK